MFTSPLYSSASYAAGKDPHPRWPSEVFLEISNICDLKCAMCPTFSPLNPNRFRNLQGESRGLMQLDAFDDHLREVLANAHVVHAFGYGEPTIHPNFRLLLEQLGNYGVWVDFFTHGMHLSEELCEFLVERGIGQITISFSGASKEDYENIYVGGDFDRVTAGIRRLDAVKKKYNSQFPEIHVNSIAFKHHVRRLPDFIELMGSAGVNTINLKPLATYDPIPELHQHGSLLSSAEDREKLQEAEKRAKEMNINLRVSISTEGEAGTDSSEELARRHKGKSLQTDQIPLVEIGARARSASQRKDYKKSPKTSDASYERRLLSRDDATIELYPRMPTCIEPLATMYVDLNGNVRPCCFANGKKVNLGQIRDQSGVEIWRSETFADLQDMIVKRTYPKDLCEMCIKASSYPKITPGKVINFFLALFSDRRINFLPWRIILPTAAYSYAQFLRPPYRAKFLGRVNKLLLWIGMARRQRGEVEAGRPDLA